MALEVNFQLHLTVESTENWFYFLFQTFPHQTTCFFRFPAFHLDCWFIPRDSNDVSHKEKFVLLGLSGKIKSFARLPTLILFINKGAKPGAFHLRCPCLYRPIRPSRSKWLGYDNKMLWFNARNKNIQTTRAIIDCVQHADVLLNKVTLKLDFYCAKLYWKLSVEAEEEASSKVMNGALDRELVSHHSVTR